MEDQEIPDRATAEAAQWMNEQNLEFDTPMFWLIAGLLGQYKNAAVAGLKGERDALVQDRRKLREIIHSWQKFCARLAKLFDCMSLDTDVEIAAKQTKRALSQAQQALRWISVSEKLPKENTVVLIVTNENTIDTAWRFRDERRFRWQLERTAPQDEPIFLDDEQLTHWMPLPALPSDAPPSSELNLPCLACGKPKNDSTMHHDAPGKNWGAALHWFEAPPSDAPEATK